MSRRTIAAVVVAWVMSLVSVGVWAQVTQGQVSPGRVVQQTQMPVITGAEIGFQPVAGQPSKDGKVTGKWMVKVNGEWRETQPLVTVVR